MASKSTALGRQAYGSSRSSYHATGVRKSRWQARPSEPMGPRSRQSEWQAEVLADVAARRTVRQLDAESYAARDDRELQAPNKHPSQLGDEEQPPFLGHDKELPVSILEGTSRHRPSGCVQMTPTALLCIRIGVASQGDDAFKEVGRRAGNRQRIPAQLVR